MKTVYTIVLFEKSTSEFHDFPDTYIHRARQVFDSGLKLDMLQEYVLIPLDIYKENKHNKPIDNKLDAWLSFLCDDSPMRIMELIEKYPDFKEMYEEVYDICRNIEGVMDMFSKELLELDRNTVQYMIEEQQEQLDAMKKEKATLEAEADRLRREVEEKRKLEAEVAELRQLVEKLMEENNRNH